LLSGFEGEAGRDRRKKSAERNERAKEGAREADTWRESYRKRYMEKGRWCVFAN
jgi:hypothetical protein